jgi:hypothetical protein
MSRFHFSDDEVTLDVFKSDKIINRKAANTNPWGDITFDE